MVRYYILNENRQAVLADLMTWAAADTRAEPTENGGPGRVAITDIGAVRISTVFLGLDHQHTPGGPPLIFETMLFGLADENEPCWRYSTWDEAAAGHARVVEAIMATIKDQHG